MPHESPGASPSSAWRNITRRGFIGLATALPSAMFAAQFRPRKRDRSFHVCLSPQAVLLDPELPAVLTGAGVSCVWLAGYFYGHWPWALEDLRRACRVLHDAGLETGIVNVPLGHPGDSLGARDGSFPLTPPPHWKLAINSDGQSFAGTSLHAPATEENVTAVRQLRNAGFSRFFLDDDFRLARGPGHIGGCFCDEHRLRFLRRTGFSDTRWPELLNDIGSRRFTDLLRQWVDFTCDELTASFRAQRNAAGGHLGIMVMYLGAEKAGIRLSDYRHEAFRVGELMFDDRSFGSVKGKTDELFSILFHRRFAAPESAWSETTAFPADGLSAQHLAAKLVLSTVADVRHTMFMSGITPFPKAHWATLGPEMRRQRSFHARLAGHQPRGPFKHYWGKPSRFVGDDRPFSLFLCLGVPFEVTHQPARDGWTFLSDADAVEAADGKLVSPGTAFVARLNNRASALTFETCPESLEALFAFKHRIRGTLRRVPYVENDEPAVLAWYPSAHTALLWNVRPEPATFLIRCGAQQRTVTLAGLESALLEDLHP